jgi:hypothetical protein
MVCKHGSFAGRDHGCSSRGLDVDRDEDEIGSVVSSARSRLEMLDGSWLIQIEPEGFPVSRVPLVGPMRIQVAEGRLRVSGDLYAANVRVNGSTTHVQAIPPSAVRIGRNWYPSFPQDRYRWYFRSTSATYSHGVLQIRLTRHVWNRSRQEFVSEDTGTLELSRTEANLQEQPVPVDSAALAGTGSIGDQPFRVRAVKTSRYYRGCLVEVDVMTNRAWPVRAEDCASARIYSFSSVYRSEGLDFQATVNAVNIPEDAELTNAELHELLEANRLAGTNDSWRLWLLVGSRSASGAFGVMFDTGQPPHREGAVAFADETLPNSLVIQQAVRNQPLGDVPLALLRTIIHEAGHAFNLFHPKHDVHGNPVGTEIMNQTGDVIGFATADDPYPCNATMAFDDHCRTSLIHSPDPQVRPGWKEFGWGHGDAWGGAAEPTDLAGLSESASAVDLRLDLSTPEELHRGEFIMATVTLTNTGRSARLVSAALNLSETDLRVEVVRPGGQVHSPRDCVLICGPRRVVVLEPGSSLTAQVQLFYTSAGFTFDESGLYQLQATFEVGDGTAVTSNLAKIVVRSATPGEERSIEALMMRRDIGVSLALGDTGSSSDTLKVAADIADSFGHTDTGLACELLLANSHGRTFRDLKTGRALRAKDVAAAQQLVASALEKRNAEKVARMAAAVMSTRDISAPALDLLDKQLTASAPSADAVKARKVIADQVAQSTGGH